MLNISRLSRLVCALGLVLIAMCADAAETGLLAYLRACGIDDEALAHFADGRQIADRELDVIRRIAVRLRDCPADRLQRLAQAEILTGGRFPARAEAKGQRGRMFEIQGLLAAVERVPSANGELLWRCTVTLVRSAGGSPASVESPSQAVVYLADVPEKLRTGGSVQHVMADGVFVKYLPGAAAEPIAVFAAPRLQWHPDSPLGDLGMDFSLFAGIHDKSALTAADHEAFYCLLRLAKNADPARLDREAERLDVTSQGLPALFHDPAAERGRLLKLSGMARRIVRVPIDDAAAVARLGADHYFEIDLAADRAQNNPLVFCTLELPDGMTPFGPAAEGEGVEVTGFFLKNWQYSTALSAEEKAANPGSPLAAQTAPLLIGSAPVWKPAVKERENSTAAAIGGLLVLGMTGVCLLLWHLRQTDQEFSRRMIARGYDGR
jgi:hypothetical protein